MYRGRERCCRVGHPWPGPQQGITREPHDASGAHRGDGRERLEQRLASRLAPHRRIHDHLGRPRDHELEAERRPRRPGVRRHVHAASQRDELVLQVVAADRDERVVPDDHEHPAGCQSSDTRPYRIEAPGHVADEPLARSGDAERVRHLRDRGPEIRERAVVDHEHPHTHPLEGPHRFAVAGRGDRDHEVGAGREHHLDARREVAADPRYPSDLGWVIALRTHPDQPPALAERVDDLRDRRRERHDAGGRAARPRPRAARTAAGEQEHGECAPHARCSPSPGTGCQRTFPASVSSRTGSSGQLAKWRCT